MGYVSLVFSILSFIFSLAAFILVIVRTRRRERTPGSSLWNDELLTRDAWLEELEAKGQAVLARIEQAERRLAAAVSAPQEGAAEPAASVEPGFSRARADDAGPVPALQQAAVRDEVRRLAAEGHDPAAIARRLQLGRGEVELFLGLPGRGPAPNDG